MLDSQVPAGQHIVESGVYEHFKGRHYLVLGLAHSAHDDDQYVVYVPLYPCDGPQFGIRSVQDFCATVDNGNGPVPRFRFAASG